LPYNQSPLPRPANRLELRGKIHPPLTSEAQRLNEVSVWYHWGRGSASCKLP
jgi:hypothetical protein